MSGIPNFGMRSAHDISAKVNKSEIVSTTEEKTEVNPGNTDGTTTQRAIRITQDEDGFYHFNIEFDGTTDIICINGDRVNLYNKTLNGEEASEGDLWRAIWRSTGMD